MKALLVTFSALAATTLAASADNLVLKGSDTLGAKLVPQLAEQFKSDHAGASFYIAAEGSATGFAALIDSALPTKESVLSKSYPYARPTFFYTDGEATGLAKDFIDFTISDDGKKIVEQVGFGPLK